MPFPQYNGKLVIFHGTGKISIMTRSERGIYKNLFSVKHI